MRTMVTGSRGQLGTALVPLLQSFSEVAATDVNELDITDRQAVHQAVRECQPDVIINTAAYTAVDAAEGDEEAAIRVNAQGPRHLAEAARDCHASLVHYSTDFVFDGQAGRPYSPDDEPRPINAYGRSKLAGEQAIRETGVTGLIIRTSWLFSPVGNNFVLTILQRAMSDAPLRVVADQRGCPTSALTLARWTADIVRSLADGRSMISDTEIIHLACSGGTTWHGLATEVLRQTGIDREISAIRSDSLNLAATRPPDSRLDCTTSLERFTLQPAEWRTALSEVLGQDLVKDRIRKMRQMHS